MTDTSTELDFPARVPVLLPMDIGTAQQAMNAYQEITRSLLKPGDWQGPPGGEDSFVKKSGWFKLANFYGVSTEIIYEEVARDDDGQPTRVKARVRASRNGRHADGDGACSVTEPRFASHRGRLKLEHDLASTAVTRATNRAISNLIGFGAVSAEEVDAGQAPHEYGKPASQKDAGGLHRAIVTLYGGEEPPDALLDRLIEDAGYLPKIVARAVMLVAAHRPGQAPAGAGVDGDAEPTPPTGESNPQPDAEKEDAPAAEA